MPESDRHLSIPDAAAQARDVDVPEIARRVLEELDTEVVLNRTLEAARELTGARYAALGVLDDSRLRLRRFITLGLDEEQRRAIGPEPVGRGILGELIRHVEPLRLHDVHAHPLSYGFPVGHPRMTSFLGVPILVGGRPYANLYLTDKEGTAEFSAEDERDVRLLAMFAGLAVDHAEQFQRAESQRAELVRTVETLDATVQIARATSGETDLGTILELVAKRGRALVGARALVIERREGPDMIVAACAGDLPRELLGTTVDSSESLASAALRTSRTLRIEEGPNRARFDRYGLGRHGVAAATGLVVPLVFRGQGHGVLIALDPHEGDTSFSADDRRLLEAFAASAATAIATAEIVGDQQRRQRLAAAEQERTRWARELHDQTLQSLAMVRLGLASHLRRSATDDATETITSAIAHIDTEIANLRALITELRPAALDALGIEGALRSLAERATDRGLEVQLAVDLDFEAGREPARHSDDLETALYRIVQEALTNAARHGRATHAEVRLTDDAERVRLVISDDGVGFDPATPAGGFGLLGMRERAQLLGGTVRVQSAPGTGTTVHAQFPVQRRHAPGAEPEARAAPAPGAARPPAPRTSGSPAAARTSRSPAGGR